MGESNALIEQADELAESARDSRRRMEERWRNAEARLAAQADEASRLEAQRQANLERARGISLAWIVVVLAAAAAVALLWPDGKAWLLFCLVVAASVPAVVARINPRAGGR
jgi:Flp pilus assembly protein TadB